MYAVAVTRDFIAQHYLIGGDWGEENSKHSHHYRVELRLEGEALDRHGYLVDIVDVIACLDAQVLRFRDRTLNDMPEFNGLNPSIERFAFILCTALADEIKAPNVIAFTVKVRENDIAWASYRLVRR